MVIDPIEEHYDMSRLRQQKRNEKHIDTIEFFDE